MGCLSIAYLTEKYKIIHAKHIGTRLRNGETSSLRHIYLFESNIGIYPAPVVRQGNVEDRYRVRVGVYQTAEDRKLHLDTGGDEYRNTAVVVCDSLILQSVHSSLDPRLRVHTGRFNLFANC
jgi:hypothetical protein